jgi:hypothetical protein
MTLPKPSQVVVDSTLRFKLVEKYNLWYYIFEIKDTREMEKIAGFCQIIA